MTIRLFQHINICDLLRFPFHFQEINMLARAVQTFANDLHQISDAIKGRTVTQIKGTLQKKAFDEAGIVIQQQVHVS